MTHTARHALEHGSAADTAGSRADELPGLAIRHLRTHDDFAACVQLQHDTWGATFSECVPAAILKVSQRIGGVCAGAFDARGRLLGFVFGMTGVEHGRLVHWSDMLAVRPELRDQGIGRRLKEFQRDTLLAIGVERIYWTYDPLVARNAHLNINRLGVQVVEYVPDMYGSETDSVLHRGIGSDRFVVAWRIAGDRDAQIEDADAAREARIVNAADARGVPTPPALPDAPAEPVLRVEIPLEIARVQSASLDIAARWRATTRAAFTWAFAHGYEVTGFVREPRIRRACYVLTHAALSSSPGTSRPGTSPRREGDR
ncbi:MAG TPA: hypothetical protein VF166_03690 [Gemmatimonadaceae bacterium]